ncbi:MAG: ribosomal-protein-alanine N-acetyltransferase [Gammaproteobacteria bacterium RIFCSPHIGHO2_12_FULL_38_11]|nr:MAG: ribosomal-protein-alanine N-acetyltransferase [Gammaproteobacteria bacterium RIFCSPHIGHO2_12_FULL_38_11]
MKFIRFIIPEDLPDIQHILQNTLSDWTPSIFQDCFNDHYYNWIIRDNNKPAGFITVKNNHDHWEIMQIVIDKNYQQQGLATKLVEYTIKQAKKLSVEKIQLEVRRSNTAAISLYQKCGFQKVGIRKKYYKDGEEAILMDKTHIV